LAKNRLKIRALEQFGFALSENKAENRGIQRVFRRSLRLCKTKLLCRKWEHAPIPFYRTLKNEGVKIDAES